MDNSPDNAIPEDEADIQAPSAPSDPSGAPGTPMAGPGPIDSSLQTAPEGAIPEDEATNLPEAPKGAIPVEEAHVDLSKNQTPLETGRAFEEGFMRANTFGASDWALDQFGNEHETAQEIKNRQEGNPVASHLGELVGVGTSMMTGAGEMAMLEKGAKALFPVAAKEAGRLATMGSAAMRGFIEMSGMATGDELSDAFLHKDKSGIAIAGHIVGSGALGMLTMGTLGAGQKELEILQGKNLGKGLTNFAIGLGAASKGAEEIAIARKQFFKDLKPMASQVSKGFERGVKAQQWLEKVVTQKIATSITDAVGTAIGGAAGAVAGSVLGPYGSTGVGGVGAIEAYRLVKKYIDPTVEKFASRASGPLTNKVAVPIMINAIKAGKVTGLTDALNYGYKASKGTKLIGNAIDSLFKVEGSKAMDFAVDPEADDDLHEYVQKGGINQQLDEMNKESNQDQSNSYAKGGIVTPKPMNMNSSLSTLYPDQDTALATTKTTVSNYLSQLRPQPPQKLTFDTPYKNTKAESSYRSALSIANQPLKVLQDLQKGKLKSDDVKHLLSMYPDLHSYLSKEMTKRITEQQIKGEKPNLRTQQGMSLFLGAPLSRSFTPEGIIASQATFAQQQPQQGPAKSTKPLDKLAKSYETPSQSRSERENK